MERLFVYGTLRRGFSNPGREILELHGEHVAMATVRGHLYEVQGLPALVVDDGAGPVAGELYRLTREPGVALARLDAYEGVGHGGPYERVLAPVSTPSDASLEAWVYAWHQPVEDGARIQSGDYLETLGSDP